MFADGTSSETVNLGQVVTYTIDLTNTGPSAATDVQVQSILSADTDIDFNLSSANVPVGTLSTAGGNLTWNIASLSDGRSATLTIIGTVTGNAPSFTTTATVTANDASSASSTATVDGNADVGVSEVVSAGDSVLPGATGAATVEAGGDVAYQITASNDGAVTATDVVVTDDLPSNFTLNNASITPSVGTISFGGGVLTWTIPSLAAGAHETLVYTETVNAPSAAENNADTVSITSAQTDEFGDATPQDNSDSGTVEVLPAASLTIRDTDGKTSVIPGTSDTYTVTVSNDGPSAATNAFVIDTIPTGFTVTGQTSSVGGVTFTNLGDGDVEWTGLNLAGGATAVFTLTGAIDPTLSAGSAFVNLATVSLPSGQIDTASSYNAVDTDDTDPTADVSIRQTDSGDLVSGTFNATTNDTTGGTAVPGSGIVYTVVVGNESSQSTVSNLALNDVLPSPVTSATWSVTVTTGGASASVSSDNTTDIADSLTLPANSSITITVDADIASSATGALVNTASLTLPAQFTDTNAFTSSTDVATLTPEVDLSITKTDGVTTLTPGTTDTYTVTVSNTGPSNAGNLSILDTLPEGFMNVTSGTLPAGVTFSVFSGTAEWSGVSLGASGTLTFTLSGVVPAVATGTFVNTASIVVPPGSTDTNSLTSATDTDSLAPQADVAIQVTDGYNATAGTFSPATNNTTGGSVISGTAFIYTVVLSNAGPSDADGLKVSDLLPTGVSGDNWVATTSGEASVTSGGSSGSGNISDVVDLPSGSSITYTIEAAVSPSATGTLTDTASVTAPAGLTDTSAFTSSTDTQTITSPTNNGMPSADLTITTTDSVGGTFNSDTNDTVGGVGVPGNTIEYVVAVSNSGPTAATGVDVGDILPAGVSGDTWTVTATSGVVSDTNGSGTGDISDIVDMSSGSSITYTIVATISPAATGSLTNDATITPPSTIEDTNAFTQSVDLVVLDPESDLSITKTDNVGGSSITGVTGLAVPGDSITYTITVSNTGPSNADDLSIVDTLPGGAMNVTSGTLPGGVTFSVASGTAEWSGVNLGSSGTLTFTLSGVVPTATGTFVNTASIVVPPGSTDTNSVASATETDSLSPTANLSISVLADGSSSETANVGQTVTFDTTVTDTGPSDGSGVSVADVLPPGLTFVASSGGVYNPNTGIWAIGTLPTGTSVTLVIIATVASDAPSFTTTATVTANDASSASSTATVDGNADVGVSEVVSAGDSVLPGATGAATVEAGGDVAYQITASNDGAVTATDVVVTDDLPSNFTLNNASITPSVGTISFGGGVLTWTIPSLAAGAHETLVYTETVNAPSAAENNADTVSITSAQTDEFGDATPQDNSDSGTVEVLPAASLTIRDTDGKTSVIPGTSDTYTVTVSNDGPSAATNAFVIDTIPTGFTVTGQTSSVGGVTFTNLGDGDVEWTGLNLAGGATAVFTLTGAIDPTLSAGSAFVNLATVSLPSGQIDTASSYNAVDTDDTDPTADVSIRQTDSGDLVSGTFNATTNDTTGGTAVPGSGIVYTVVVGNESSQSTVSNLALNDVLPSPVTSATWSVTVTTGGASASVSSDNTTDIADSLTLPANSSITITVDADIASSATGALVNTASLTLPAQFTDTNAFTSSTDVATLTPEVDLSITKTDNVGGSSITGATGTAVPGDPITYTIVVSNTGSSDASDVSVVDLLPPGGLDTITTTQPPGVTFSSVDDTWTVGTLGAGDDDTMTLSGTIRAGATGPSYVDTATASASDASTVSATDTDTLTPVADVSVTKSASSSTPAFETQDTFTVTASDSGPSDAGKVVVTDTLAAGLLFVSDTYAPSTGSVVVSGQSVTWTISDLTAGTTDTLKIVVTVDTGEATNQASFSQAEPNSSGQTTGVSNPVSIDACGVGLTPHLFSATARTGDFLGLFCVNASGTGTYAQGAVHGTGTITGSGSTTRVTAYGTDLALLGVGSGPSSSYRETAPLRSAGTFTLS